MSSRSGHRSTAGRALWLGGLLLTLAGLFGMHGLAGHGTEESGIAATGAAHSAMTSPTSPTSASTVVEATTPGDPMGGMGMDMGATGMCMAVLVLTLITSTVHLHGSRRRPLVLLTGHPVRAVARSGRALDAPHLHVLSIQRC